MPEMNDTDGKTLETKNNDGQQRGLTESRETDDLELGQRVLLLVLHQSTRKSLRQKGPVESCRTSHLFHCLRDLDPEMQTSEFSDWLLGLIDDRYLMASGEGNWSWVALTAKGANSVKHLDTDSARWSLVQKFAKRAGHQMVRPTRKFSPFESVSPGMGSLWLGKSIYGIDLWSGSPHFVGRHVSESFSDSDLLEFESYRWDCFDVLWEGNWRCFGILAPSQADELLCWSLAFWTGRNSSRMDRMFRESGLFRQRWDEGSGSQTYGEFTIQSAIEDTAEVWAPRFLPPQLIWALRPDRTSQENAALDPASHSPAQEPEGRLEHDQG